jgi:hypothetical protein
MTKSVQEMKDLVLYQFTKYVDSGEFIILEENLSSESHDLITGKEINKGSVSLTFVIPETREVWQIIAILKNGDKWKCRVFSFLGSIELTPKQEQLLEKSFNTVWQDQEYEWQGNRALEESLDQHYSKFTSDQLELLNKINPTTPNGVSFTPCQNSNANVLNWWIRAELETEEPELEAVFQAGRFTTSFIRKELDSLKVMHALAGFEAYM